MYNQLLTDTTRKMYEKVLQFIERGDLKHAVKVLRSVGNLKALIPKDVLGYFQLSRRVGDFHHGALQLEKLGELFPELEIESVLPVRLRDKIFGFPLM